jgi:hypothetical protein
MGATQSTLTDVALWHSGQHGARAIKIVAQVIKMASHVGELLRDGLRSCRDGEFTAPPSSHMVRKSVAVGQHAQRSELLAGQSVALFGAKNRRSQRRLGRRARLLLQQLEPAFV